MRRRVVAVLVGCALSLTAAAVEATTIAVVQSAFNVYIGVDSLRRVGDQRTTSCKIQRTGDTILALTGVVAYEGAPYAIDDAVARTAGTWVGTVEQRADLLADALRTQLLSLSRFLLAGDEARRDFYDRRLRDQQVIQFVVTRSERGLQRVAIRLLVPSVVDGAAVVAIRAIEFEGYVVLGTSAAARRMGPAEQQLLFTLPGAVVARRLVEAEIRETPEAVGPPVQIIEAGSAGLRWIERTDVCGDGGSAGQPGRLQ